MGERNVAAPAAGELIAQKVADRIRDLTQLPPVMQGAGVVAIQADLRAAIDLALAPAEPARGEVTPAPELADQLSQMAAAIGAWDDDPIMLTDFLCEIGARALLWEAMARITETATLTERLARAEEDSKRIGEVEHRGWAIVPLAVGGYSVVEFTKSGCHEVASGMGPLRCTIDAALRAAAGGEHG